MLPGKDLKIRHPGHCSVILHDFTDNPGRLHTSKPRKINRTLGLSGPYQNPTLPCPEREHMTGSGNILGSAVIFHDGLYGGGPVVRGNAGGDSSARLD